MHIALSQSGWFFRDLRIEFTRSFFVLCSVDEEKEKEKEFLLETSQAESLAKADLDHGDEVVSFFVRCRDRSRACEPAPWQKREGASPREVDREVSTPRLNWPTAVAVMVLGGLGILVWFVLVYTGKIPGQVPAWYVPLVGGGSFIGGAFFDTVRWVKRAVSSPDLGEDAGRSSKTRASPPSGGGD